VPAAHERLQRSLVSTPDPISRMKRKSDQCTIRQVHDGVPVLLRQGRFLVASFHPELTGDRRVHEKFLELVREESGVRA